MMRAFQPTMPPHGHTEQRQREQTVGEGYEGQESSHGFLISALLRLSFAAHDSISCCVIH